MTDKQALKLALVLVTVLNLIHIGAGVRTWLLLG